MKENLLRSVTVLGLIVLVVLGCSKIPQTELDAAKNAIEEANLAGAVIYVPEAFAALQDSLDAALVDIEGQKSKFVKNFSNAKTNLVEVALTAQKVKEQALARKEEVKIEVQNLLAETKTLIEANNQLILEAPKGKEGASALVAIKGELNTIDATVAEANTLYEKGEFMGSLDKSKAAKEKASAINSELTEVIAKYKVNSKSKKG
jgi:hypothetical protein